MMLKVQSTGQTNDEMRYDVSEGYDLKRLDVSQEHFHMLHEHSLVSHYHLPYCYNYGKGNL